jgi:hypothetical protein
MPGHSRASGGTILDIKILRRGFPRPSSKTTPLSIGTASSHFTAVFYGWRGVGVWLPRCVSSFALTPSIVGPAAEGVGCYVVMLRVDDPDQADRLQAGGEAGGLTLQPSEDFG